MEKTQPKKTPSPANKEVVKVAKGAGTAFAGSVVGRGLWFLCQVSVARFFGAEVFGLYILGVTALKLSELVARSGLHTGAMRFISINRKDSPGKVKGTLTAAVSISFLAGALLGALMHGASGAIAAGIFRKPELVPFIKAFSFGVPFMAAMNVVSMASQGFHTAKYSALVKDIIQPGLNLFFVLAVYYAGVGHMGAVYAFAASCAAAMLAGLWFTGRLAAAYSKGVAAVYETGALIRYSLPLLFVGFLHFFLMWTDTIMIGMMRSSQDVGIYKAAAQIPLMLAMVLGAANSIYAPVVAELFHRGESEKMQRLFKTTTRWVYVIVLPASLWLAFSAREVMAVFGADFAARGVPVLLMLTGAQFINCVTGGVGYTLIMTGRQKLELGNSVALLSVNVALNLLLIPRYGIAGAAVATASSISLINLLRLLEVYWLYGMHPYAASYMKAFVPAAVSAALMMAAQQAGVQPPWSAALNFLVVGAIFFAYMRITGFDEDERYIMGLVRQKVASRFGGADG